jgi:hypothetical protein
VFVKLYTMGNNKLSIRRIQLIRLKISLVQGPLYEYDRRFSFISARDSADGTYDVSAKGGPCPSRLEFQGVCRIAVEIAFQMECFAQEQKGRLYENC